MNFQLDKLNDLSGRTLSHISQAVKRHERGGIRGKKAGDRGREIFIWQVEDVAEGNLRQREEQEREIS